MDYLATSINESPVISEKAGAELSSVRCKAVKYDTDGNVVIAGAGDAAFGIAIITNDETIQAGGDVNVQISAIGLVKAGAEIKKGDKLGPDANGALVPVTSGAYIATAIQEASAAGPFIQAVIERGSLNSNS